MPKRFTKEEFIERAIKVHGDKYDYSKVEYVNINTKVCIICPVHGEFWQRSGDHLLGSGCARCSGVKQMETCDFIEKAHKVHGDKYDYSKVEYKNNNKTKVCIICPEHGEFWQRPNDHLSGYGCPMCGMRNKPYTTEEFIEKCSLIHDNKFDYSKVKYKNMSTKVCIICPEHGEFWQTPAIHANGAGCPICNVGNKSKMECNIRELLLNEGYEIECQKTFDWLKYNKNLFLDFYIDEYKVAIEVQGDQHFNSIEKFGGYSDFILRKKRDKAKKELCEKHNIKLFYITKKNYSIDEIINYINETSNKKK